MPTGYSQAQLDALADVLDEVAPALPDPDDRKSALQVNAMRVAGTDVGILANLGFVNGETLLVMMNCVVSLELLVPLIAASMTHGWAKHGLKSALSDHLQEPLPDHLATAKQVTGLSTYGMEEGILVRLFMPDEGSDGETVTLFFAVSAALEMALMISNAGDRAGWWTPDLELIPARGSQN